MLASAAIALVWYGLGRNSSDTVSVGAGGGFATAPAPGVIATQPPPAVIAAGATTTVRPTVYVVKQGDLFYKIAYDFKISQEALLAANPTLSNPNDLKWGITLNIPPIEAGPPSTVTTTTIPRKPLVPTLPPDK